MLCMYAKPFFPWSACEMNCCWVVWWFIVLDLCNSSLSILFLHFHLIKGIQYIVFAQSFLFWNLADDSVLSKCTKSNTQHIAHWNNMYQFTAGEVYWEWFGDLVLRRKWRSCLTQKRRKWEVAWTNDVYILFAIMFKFFIHCTPSVNILFI
jgi:hypothetical protein